MIDLDALERLEKCATESGWRLFDSGGVLEISPPTGLLGESPSVVAWAGFDQSDMPLRLRRTNANLIVEARNALPELIRLARIGQQAEMDRGVRKEPDFLSQALNEGDGVYRP